ncbi:MAG: Glutamate--tRNA ligase [Gammaproteobacteria bacterium]|nr:Glutamate--tRNA ligase [Gammaproteobacteria bacterium]
MAVRTRFPPSPTGFLHIGGARTALFNWLYTRRHKGRMVLRIEDTDRERSTEESVQAIFEGLEWLTLDYDEGPYYQTRRMNRYAEVIRQLLDSGWAYRCYCTKEELEAMREQQRAEGIKTRYDGRCRERLQPEPGVDPVVRFKNPRDGCVVIDDLIRGRIVIGNNELDDLIIARSDGSPTYNLTVVVDDIDMEISHVIRGDDHINNTPRQINIIKALEAPLPVYAHVPMILGPDGKRMSKRHGAVSVTEYREQGFLPHAVLNYLARLGWSHGDDELFSVEQLVNLFDIDAVHRNPAVFDPEKLLWVNYEHIKAMPVGELKEHARFHFEKAGIDIDAQPHWREIIDVNRERSKTLVELVDRSRFFCQDVLDYDPEAMKKHVRGNAGDILLRLRDRFSELEPWAANAIHAQVHAVAGEFDVGLGKVAQPIRVAVTGAAVSPPIDETLAILGREKTVERLERLLEHLKTDPAQASATQPRGS